jgi:DegV family protein with EDD domain
VASVHIVTDSGAHFVNPHFVHQHPITMLPNRISLSGRLYREGIDIAADEAMRLIAQQAFAPTITPPSTADYVTAYTRLAKTHEMILSIHTSRELSASWHNAKAAAQQLMGHSNIVVIDSQTICVGQALLVRVAAKAIEGGVTPDELVRLVRGTVERLYSVYYVETLDFLLQNKVIAASHSILGSMLGIKPFVTIEDGKLLSIEKVRTRAQAVERLVEFLIEFMSVEDAVILQHKTHMTEQTRMLQERLALEMPGRYFPYAMYGPSLAALIGTDATGLVVLEGELEGLEDDD